MIDYIFKFSDLAHAQADLIVGPQVFSSLLVFNGGNSVTPLPGFWLLIASPPNNALSTHPNIQVVSDNGLARAGLPSVSLAHIDVSDIRVVISNFGSYINGKLRMIGG